MTQQYVIAIDADALPHPQHPGDFGKTEFKSDLLRTTFRFEDGCFTTRQNTTTTRKNTNNLCFPAPVDDELLVKKKKRNQPPFFLFH